MLSLLVQIMSRKHLCCDCRRFRSSDKWLTQSSFCRSYPNTWSAGHGIRLMRCWRITRSTYPLRVSSPLGTYTRLFPDGAVEENFCHRISHQNLAGFVVPCGFGFLQDNCHGCSYNETLLSSRWRRVSRLWSQFLVLYWMCKRTELTLWVLHAKKNTDGTLSFGHFWNFFFSCFRCMPGVVLVNDIRALLSYKLVYTGIIVISMETNCCWTADARHVAVRKLVESTCS